jgi:pimeloyl-ACP methyl ester carboxylesterase
MAWPLGTSLRRAVLVAVLVAVVAVGTVMAMLWALQRQLIYFPDATTAGAAAEAIPGARDVTVRTADGLELAAWFVPAATERDTGMAVLLAPGNGGNRAGRAEFAERLSGRGLAVLLMDYRGYGGNPGTPSEDGLAADADAAVQTLADLGYPSQRTLYFGESLGTGVVAALQARHPPAGLVLRSPFPDLAEVGAHHYPWLPVSLLLRDRFPTVQHLTGSDVPVTVIYGDSDSVIPARLSAQVADQASALAERVVLANADHNDPVMFGPRVADAVARLADTVA